MQKTEQLAKIKNTVRALLETLFLALTGLYLLHRTTKITTFSLRWPAGFTRKLLIVMAVVALLKLLTTRLARWKTLAALALALVWYMVYRSDGYLFLLYLAVLTVGLMDIDYRRILRVFIVVVGGFSCVAVIAGMTGMIRSYIRIKSGLRTSWGICYPTDLASVGLVLLLALWIERRSLPDWAALILGAGNLMLSWNIAHSYTSTGCTVLFMVAVLWHMFERGVVDRRPRLAWMKKGSAVFETAAFPLFALAFFALMFFYARGLGAAYRMNDLMSERLTHAVAAWRKYGVKAFGTPFTLAGNGFSDFPPRNYTFVDSSYPLILIRYGWVTLIALCLTWGYTARQAVRCGDRRLMLVLGILAAHSFSEHHFTEINYNILLVMPFAAYAAPGEELKEVVRPLIKARGGGDAPLKGKPLLAAVITATLCVAGLYFGAPALFSWLKTALEASGIDGSRASAPALIGTIVALLCAFAACAWGLNRIIRALLERAPARKWLPGAIALALCAAAGCGGWLWANRTIDRACRDNAALVAADREALEIAAASASGKVYSGILPAVYRRSVGGVSYSAYFGDDLARHRGSTALMDADSEHSAFFDSGCLYVQISDEHALYTSDRPVIEALTAAGYRLTGYYNNVTTVSMTKAAGNNKLVYTEKDGLRLSDTDEVLKRGPYYDLYGGRYTVTFELSLPQGQIADEGLYCTLGVSAYAGADQLLTKKIMGAQFDENGALTVSIPFSVPDSRNVAFTAHTEEGRTIYVRSIRFARTPAYDIHHLYDSRLREVRVEYYTLDGAPTHAKGGYFAIEKEYDRAGNVNRQRYYNRRNQLTLCTSGYAERRRTFNAKNKVVREEYYGTDGAPIALTSRAAAVEMSYDDAGNAIVTCYYGVDGQPVITKSGYAELRRAFDDDRNVVRESYYGVDGEPIPLSTGQYAIEQAFDEDGNVTVRRFYGEDGQLKLRKDGYAEVHWQYNGMHQIVREEYYGEDGQPIAISNRYAADEREYDDAGNVTVYRYYGTDGERVKIKSGYAELHRAYDRHKRVVREEYYDTDGEPIALPAGQYAIENDYDDVDNVSVRRFYGKDGRLKLRTDGYAEVHWQYNGMRKIVREEFFGTDGQPIAINTGAAANEREYDSAGNVCVYRYFGEDGQPIVIHSGYAELHREYNGKRQVVREAYFGTDGRPMAQPEGHCSVEQEYDAWSNVCAQRFFDEAGRPVETVNGYAEVRREYNRKKQLIREEYYGVDGKPCARRAGHSAIEQEFDKRGELSARRYLDGQGNPIQRVDGYAQARWVRDEKTGVRRVTFCDLKGDEIPVEGLNLVMDAPDAWSGWFTPKTDTKAVTFPIATMNLGEKAAGDTYVCRVEIEFLGVTATQDRKFLFRAEGATDGKKSIGNVWNDALVKLTKAPADGVYTYTSVQTVTEDMVGADLFSLSFRCDNWASGSFRVRCVKVERGSQASAWTPGL